MPKIKQKLSETLDPRMHYVVATAIIVNKEGKYLIAKRASWEKVHPDKWTVPGGKLRLDEYNKAPLFHNQYYNVVHWVLNKEVKDEVGLEIAKPELVCDLVFVRPDGIPVVTLSYWAKHKKGKVELRDKSLTEHAWVSLKEAKKFDLIPGIWEEIRDAEKIIKKK